MTDNAALPPRGCGSQVRSSWTANERLCWRKELLWSRKRLLWCGKELEPRLPAGITEGLSNDLVTLPGSKVVRPAFGKVARAKTGGERAAAKDGADLLSRMRHGIKVSPLATPEVLKAIGVGAQVSPTKTSSVAESLTAFLNASKAYTDAFRAAGVLDSDLAEASSLLGNLLQADEAQQDAQDTKKELTEQKNAAQLRIEGDVASIAAAGQMHFRKETAKRAVFEKLLPKSKPKGEKGEETVPKT